ncbi:hypothetical protein CKAH01_12909 [Colletotrichum kahawae]|uniref:Uncharacterized protein n=1 Tax=Colletotrichum kahawae TaxID=34407 RepID=A0AAD9YQ04_COLKA|nr:hypothetical protein CKAH01_12909 [Colletotrichum kahawae]
MASPRARPLPKAEDNTATPSLGRKTISELSSTSASCTEGHARKTASAGYPSATNHTSGQPWDGMRCDTARQATPTLARTGYWNRQPPPPRPPTSPPYDGCPVGSSLTDHM